MAPPRAEHRPRGVEERLPRPPGWRLLPFAPAAALRWGRDPATLESHTLAPTLVSPHLPTQTLPQRRRDTSSSSSTTTEEHSRSPPSGGDKLARTQMNARGDSAPTKLVPPSGGRVHCATPPPRTQLNMSAATPLTQTLSPPAYATSTAIGGEGGARGVPIIGGTRHQAIHRALT